MMDGAEWRLAEAYRTVIRESRLFTPDGRRVLDLFQDRREAVKLARRIGAQTVRFPWAERVYWACVVEKKQ